MVDFGELAAKAENLAKEHADQVDDAIDKAAGLVGGKFGHSAQVEQGAEKLKDLIPGKGDDDTAKPKAKQPGQAKAKAKGKSAGSGAGNGRHERKPPAKRAGKGAR